MKMTKIKKFVIAERNGKFWVEKKIMGMHCMRIPVQNRNKNGTSSVKTFTSHEKAEEYISNHLVTKYHSLK